MSHVSDSRQSAVPVLIGRCPLFPVRDQNCAAAQHVAKGHKDNIPRFSQRRETGVVQPPAPIALLCRFCGTYSLEIYAIQPVRHAVGGSHARDRWR